MADNETSTLPEGTDTVIEGAADKSEAGGAAAAENTTLVREDISDESSSGGRSEGGLADRFRDGRERFASQAGEKARGLVTQGLERTAEALANVSKMIGETAPGIEERLGPEYSDYARRAAGAIENVANSIAEKDPDELIEDTRNFVRNSPGIALAGAAVVGFVVARLFKNSVAGGEDDEDDRD